MRGILLPPGERGDAKDAPRLFCRAGEPAWDTRWSNGLRGATVLAREDEPGAIERRDAEEAVGMEYLAGPRSGVFEGVDGRAFEGGTTTQFLVSSSLLFAICLLFPARGGVASRGGLAM